MRKTYPLFGISVRNKSETGNVLLAHAHKMVLVVTLFDVFCFLRLNETNIDYILYFRISSNGILRENLYWLPVYKITVGSEAMLKRPKLGCAL